MRHWSGLSRSGDCCVLNRNGLRTGRGNFWTRERVTALRSHHEIPVYSRSDVPLGWMTLTEAAGFIGVSPGTSTCGRARRNVADIRCPMVRGSSIAIHWAGM